MTMKNKKGKIIKKQIRKKWYPRYKLWVDMIVQALIMYQVRYLTKVPCFNSDHTGIMWMREIVDLELDARCLNALEWRDIPS